MQPISTNIPRMVFATGNNLLIFVISPQEIKNAVVQMGSSQALRPNGFGAGFF